MTIGESDKSPESIARNKINSKMIRPPIQGVNTGPLNRGGPRLKLVSLRMNPEAHPERRAELLSANALVQTPSLLYFDFLNASRSARLPSGHPCFIKS